AILSIADVLNTDRRKGLRDQPTADRHVVNHQNLQHLDQYLKTEGGELLMKDGSLVPLANRRKEAFLQQVNSK
ncbi:MAG: hypothetical protein AAFO69_11685, partial [Bacteroidota bacterium]